MIRKILGYRPLWSIPVKQRLHPHFRLTSELMLHLNVCSSGWVIDSNTVRSVTCVSSMSFPEPPNRWDRPTVPILTTGPTGEVQQYGLVVEYSRSLTYHKEVCSFTGTEQGRCVTVCKKTERPKVQHMIDIVQHMIDTVVSIMC